MAAAQKANDDEKVDLAAADNYEFTGYRRHLQGWQGLLLFWICVAFTVFHLLILNVFPIDSILFRAIHVGWGGVIAFAVYAPLRGRTLNSIPLYDWLFILLSVACAGYVAYFIDELQFRAGALYEPGDVVAGAIGTLLILEMTRRTAGLALPIIAGLFILYCFVGPWLPGMLYHKGYDFGFFFSYIYSDQGIFGVTTQVSSTYIVLFITFGAFLTASKAGDYMNDLAVSLVGWARGGPAKVAVLSGILFGTISGSAVGNVVASGMITIPMMRRVGYDRSTAGAIEATSSTGGQITPPVMGAGAFLMAEITGIPYTDIALAAVIPCLLFYLACYVHCDLHAVKHGLRGLPRNELTPISKMLRKAYLLAPIFVLIGSLLMGYSEFRSGTLGILSALIVSWLHRDHRMGPRATLAALETAARETAQLVAICACAGIIVGVIALTGVGGRFSHLILGIAGESQVLAMFFAMLISLILGMGMPTTAAYAVAASVVAPGLIRIGVEPIVAHMFIFYYAVISSITPPVALASFAAAAIAQADQWRTSMIAVKLGLATFIVPFMFFVSPLLLAQGDLLGILYVFATASAGVFFLACSTEGWLNGPLVWPLRILLFGGAICLITPETITDIIGVTIGSGIWIFQRLRHGADPGAKIPSPA
ncbi:MAG: TRAP transporter permease [Ferrovibrio sp.]|uniref:TRAP transporter permease n=1 Tax=Ferrovibrio sp. TaxID=1917215 RepID=UPI00391D9D8A